MATRFGNRYFDPVLVPVPGRHQSSLGLSDQLLGRESVRRIARDASPHGVSAEAADQVSPYSLNGPHRSVLGSVLQDERECAVLEPTSSVGVSQRLADRFCATIRRCRGTVGPVAFAELQECDGDWPQVPLGRGYTRVECHVEVRL